MVFSRGLVISLGVSALSATLLFLYFRNRITTVERKVDVMFDLIQSHESDRQQMVQQQMMMAQQSNPAPSNTGAWVDDNNKPERNLIDVSDDDDDDDEEYESDDSREVSDNEEDLEERIKLVTTDINLEEVVPHNDVVVLESQTDEPVNLDKTVELEEVTVDPSLVTSTNNEEESQQTQEKETVSDEEADDSLEDDSEEEEESDDNEEPEVQQVAQEIEYNKLKVSELKSIAEAKGLTNYKSLKKQPLIDLIKASE